MRFNNCAMFVAAYVADICSGKSVLDALYVDSEAQRKWFAEVLKSGVLQTCPRLATNPSRFSVTNPPESKLFCTTDDAK